MNADREDEIFDLMPVRKTDPVESLRRMMNWDFCRSGADETPPPRVRSATADTNLSISSHEVDGLDQVVKNAKAAFESFWQNNDGTKPKGEHARATHKEVKVTTRDMAMDVVNSDEEEEENEVITNVIVTEPGTSRALRVYRGLELFSLAVFVVAMTVQLIRMSGIELDFVLETKDRLN